MKINALLFGTKSFALPWATLLLRLGTGFFMTHYGWEKLTHFSEKAADWPDPLHVGSFMSLALTVFAELVCSVLVTIGFLTRPALVVLIATMLIIIFVVHAGQPLSEREHALLFLFPYAALFLLGPGPYAVDSLIKK